MFQRILICKYLRVIHPNLILFQKFFHGSTAGYTTILYLYFFVKLCDAKLTFLHACFSRFLNSTDVTKSHKASHLFATWPQYRLCYHHMSMNHNENLRPILYVTISFISARLAYYILSIDQKQSSIGVLRKRSSENIQQIYRNRKPMPKCDFACLCSTSVL